MELTTRSSRLLTVLRTLTPAGKSRSAPLPGAALLDQFWARPQTLLAKPAPPVQENTAGARRSSNLSRRGRRRAAVRPTGWWSRTQDRNQRRTLNFGMADNLMKTKSISCWESHTAARRAGRDGRTMAIREELGREA